MTPKSPGEIVIVRKKRGHRVGHGGAWKVAYADFVTAMMAFFLVMWLVNQSKETRAAVAGYFRDPGAFAAQQSKSVVPGGALAAASGAATTVPAVDVSAAKREQAMLLETAAQIHENLLKLPELASLRDQIEITVTSEGLRIDLIEREGSSFFDSGSAVLRGASERILAVVAQEVRKLRNDVIIEGHTDSRPYVRGERYGNWELSADRANAARRVVELHGLRPSQVRDVRGYADTRLHLPSNPLDPRNRRISIVVRSQAVADIENAIATGR